MDNVKGTRRIPFCIIGDGKHNSLSDTYKDWFRFQDSAFGVFRTFWDALKSFLLCSYSRWKMWAWACGLRVSTIGGLWSMSTTSSFASSAALMIITRLIISLRDRWCACGRSYRQENLTVATWDDTGASRSKESIFVAITGPFSRAIKGGFHLIQTPHSRFVHYFMLFVSWGRAAIQLLPCTCKRKKKKDGKILELHCPNLSL